MQQSLIETATPADELDMRRAHKMLLLRGEHRMITLSTPVMFINARIRAALGNIRERAVKVQMGVNLRTDVCRYE